MFIIKTNKITKVNNDNIFFEVNISAEFVNNVVAIIKNS